MKVDVVMCTWNSNKPYFVKCLESIKREVPIHHFILVDRFSNDGTVETVKKVFPNLRIKESNASLAAARKLGIKLVDTEFFVFVDSDMELCNGWFKRIMSHFDSKTGGIHGSIVYMCEHLTAWFNWLRKITARFKEPYAKAYAEKVVICTSQNSRFLRGRADNTLIRTSAVKDWNPSVTLSAFEDHMILIHVIRKGYMWKALLDPTAIDHGVVRLKDWLHKGRWKWAGARFVKYENMSIWSLLKDASKESIQAVFASLQTKQPMILPYVTLFQLSRIQGWVGWMKFLEMKR